MKTAVSALLMAMSSVVFSPTYALELKQEFLSDRADFGAWEISAKKNLLDKSLSADLQPHVLQSSGPYTLTNMKEMQTLIEREKSKLYPSLKLSLKAFKNDKAIQIGIDSIETMKGRDILRGKVDGFNESQVRLVVYQGQMSGRVTFSDEKKVLVIRSIDGGIAANYEVDTSEITYD